MFQKSWRLALLIWDVYVTSAVHVLWMSGYGVSGAGSCFPWKQSVDYLRTMLHHRAPWQGNGSNSSHQKKSSVIACVPRLEAHNQLEEIGLDHNRIKLDKQTPFFFPVVFRHWLGGLKESWVFNCQKESWGFNFFCHFYTWLKVNHTDKERWVHLGCGSVLP